MACVIVYDLGRPPTFEAVLKWKADVDAKVQLANGAPIPTLLLANKCDIPGVAIDRAKLDSFCKEHGFIAWFPTSAQDDIGINEAMNVLIGEILKVAKDHNAHSPHSEDTISLVDSHVNNSEREEKGCKC
jgi:hypothetical protein